MGVRSRLRFWRDVLVLCAVLDVVLTWLALRMGGVEADPVMAAVFARWGFAPGCLAKMGRASCRERV